MLKRKLGLLVAAAVMVGMFTSCLNVNVNKDNGSGDSGEIDYHDYSKEGYSIMVKNDSAKNVVCFMNTPREENLISGAKAGVPTGLKKNSLFTKSHDFVLYVVTEEDYLANKSNLKALDGAPFATLYAYYNADSDSEANMVYTISSNMGGQSYFLLNNSTNYNVELRSKGLNGESLAFSGANTMQTKIYVAYDDYYIYPVFRKFSSKTNEIVTCFPKEKDIDKPVYFEFSLSENGDQSREFIVADWFDPDCFKDYSTPGAAYIAITNANTKTGISLYKGSQSEAETTSTGGKKINTGKTLVFEVPMLKTGNKTFAKSATVSGWKVGTSADRATVPDIEVQAGKMYFLTVKGTNAYQFPTEWKMTKNEAGEDIFETEDIDFEDQ